MRYLKYILIFSLFFACKKQIPPVLDSGIEEVDPRKFVSTDVSTSNNVETGIGIIQVPSYNVIHDEFTVMLPSTLQLHDTYLKSVKMYAANKEESIIAILTHYPSKYTDLDALFDNQSSQLLSQGGKIVGHGKLYIYGKLYLFIASYKDEMHVWQWMTLINGKKWALSCGQMNDDIDSAYDVCRGIAHTLNIE